MPVRGYDRAYFDRWYRAPRTRVFSAGETARRVRFVVATAEQLLERPLRRVLDVCCGEAHWQPVLRQLRPRAQYVGVDASDYAVSRFGAQRNVRLGRFGDLGTLGLPGPFDLVICAGALYYIATAELRQGLPAITKLVGDGVAFLEIFTDRDGLSGSVSDIERRSAATYSRLMRDAGLSHLGLHCWVGPERSALLAEFERGRS